jgi:hypothetical protein
MPLSTASLKVFLHIHCFIHVSCHEVQGILVTTEIFYEAIHHLSSRHIKCVNQWSYFFYVLPITLSAASINCLIRIFLTLSNPNIRVLPLR